MVNGLAETTSLPSSPSPSSSHLCSLYAATPVSVDEDELTIAFLLRKQEEFLPEGSYSADLQSNPILCHLRCNAARWMTKALVLHKFDPVTVVMAVNYLDRYLQRNLSLPWKAWMMELLSVTCLSLAAKMEEVEVPALLDLQIEGLEHLFQAKTVQRMELNVLSAIRWRLRCVTPFAFAEKAINFLDIRQHLKSSLLIRVSELILGILTEVDFLDFNPSVLAATSVCCGLEELFPLRADLLKHSLLEYVSVDKEKLRRCYILMEAMIVDPLIPIVSLSGHTTSPLSPNTVICHFEDSSSVDNKRHHFQLVSKLLVERVDLPDAYASSRKRQRRV